jgi:hypothetical protein
MRHFDLAPVDPAFLEFDRARYKALLWQLLALADARWAERAERDAYAIAPWKDTAHGHR